MGLPMPGETALISAAIYAGTTQHLDIAFVIAAAAIGAIAGDNIGFWIGRRFGYRLLVRFGSVLRLTPQRIKLGQYLFHSHGGKVVFFGRFVAILRTLSALLAGINQMPASRFFMFNAAGGVVWSASVGLAAYVLGKQIDDIRGPLGIAGMVLGGIAAIAGFWFVRRHEAELEEKAERALPGRSLASAELRA